MSASFLHDGHYPVMMPEVLDGLCVRDGGIYVDGTFGAGGYTRAILRAADCRVFAIDRDEVALSRLPALQAEFGDRLTFLRGRFGDVKTLLNSVGVFQVDGFVMDLGVSSMQIDDGGRGFSFRFDGPLDMRMDQANGQSAADIVNSYEETELANLIYQYGEERLSRRIAHKIVERRAQEPFARTLDLADVVRSVVPRSPRDKIDQATRSFQALRIAVNDELGELTRALDASVDILRPDGRLVVVSFHSLEDRIVKEFIKDKAQKQPRGSRHMPQLENAVAAPAEFTLVSRKAIKPSEKEVSENTRSRSARMRVAVRTFSACEAGGV